MLTSLQAGQLIGIFTLPCLYAYICMALQQRILFNKHYVHCIIKSSMIYNPHPEKKIADRTCAWLRRYGSDVTKPPTYGPDIEPNDRPSGLQQTPTWRELSPPIHRYADADFLYARTQGCTICYPRATYRPHRSQSQYN